MRDGLGIKPIRSVKIAILCYNLSATKHRLTARAINYRIWVNRKCAEGNCLKCARSKLPEFWANTVPTAATTKTIKNISLATLTKHGKLVN